MPIEAIVFDLDGVITDTERIWHSVRAEFTVAHGGRWTEHDQRILMGTNSVEWSTYMRANCGIVLEEAAIYSGVVEALKARYRTDPPFLPGVRDAILRLAERFPLAVASSSPSELIGYALDLADLRACFDAIVSSDEVAHGKPAPDVYLKACHALRVNPGRALAVEDSENGIKSAAAARMTVAAIPCPQFPPSEQTLKLAALVLPSISDLTSEAIDRLVSAEV